MNASIIHLMPDHVMSEGNQPGSDTTPHLMIWGEREKMKKSADAINSYAAHLGCPKYIGAIFSCAVPYRESGESIFSRKRNSAIIFDKSLLLRLVPEEVEDKELEILSDIVGMEDIAKRLTGLNTNVAKPLCEVYSTVAGWFMALLNGDAHLPASGDKCDEG
jgi:hypothetical protein